MRQRDSVPIDDGIRHLIRLTTTMLSSNDIPAESSIESSETGSQASAIVPCEILTGHEGQCMDRKSLRKVTGSSADFGKQ